MPSISIDFPTASTPLGTPFDAGGSLSLAVEDNQPTERVDGDPSVECWMIKNSTRYDSTPVSITNTSWRNVFSNVPSNLPGQGTIYAKLHVGGKTYDATPVSGISVIKVPPSGDTVAARSHGTPGGREAGEAATKSPGPRAAAAYLKPIHVHHRVTMDLIDNWAQILRSVSAAFVHHDTGEPITRVFDGQINVLDGNLEIHMNLRQALDQQGDIRVRVELWPNLVVPWLFQRNLIVTADR